MCATKKRKEYAIVNVITAGTWVVFIYPVIADSSSLSPDPDELNDTPDKLP